MDAFASPENASVTRARLEARLRAINDEIRDYPQPIARCDAQLGGLLEERGRIREQIEALEARLPSRG
ncbi:MAG TPA: hypothetical protein VF038_00940 [Usitatibacter sp.]